MTLKVLDLFSGIGGFSLGLERAGFETVAFCEIEDYPVKVLNKHWPNVPVYRDVRELTKEKLDNDGIKTVDIICAGFPCQDLSVAGKQEGIEAERSGLWSECARLLGEIRPRYAIFENVTALLNGGGGDWFKRVLWDISQVGYDAEWHCISASELGAHHHRDRIWIMAYPISVRRQRQGKLKQSLFAKAYREGKTINAFSDGECEIWRTEPELGRVANGIPNRPHRLKALGNAVVPQIPEIIGRAIIELENNR